MRRFASFHVAGAKIAMNLSHLLTALLGVAVACFIGGAEASPHLQAPKFSTLPTQAGFNCGLINGKLVCGDKKNTKHNDDDDNDQGKNNDDNDQKPKGKKTAKDCKKARCEPGLVVLEKPNKYGACCEAREGLPPPAAEKCKFPGEVGTPPNCQCPNGTEFLGYKGCVKFTYQEAYCINPSVPGGGFNTKASEDLAAKCKSEGGYGQCPTKESCCCMKKVYAN